MTDVYFTWFGPPAAANKIVPDIQGPVRPDLFGILRTARARFSGKTPPHFKFCCMRQFADRFRGELPRYVEVVPIEDQFESRKYHSIFMTKPDLENPGATVDFILRESLTFRGNRGLPGKQLAFLKDIWSLYCMWRFGGYHLDCGCSPGNEGPVNFPEPATFGLVADTRGGTTYPHCTVRFPSGKVCATLRQGYNVFAGKVLAGLTVSKGDSRLNRNIDVWLLRSPAGNKAAKIALEFYLKGWFEINAKKLGDELRGQALRELIISAVATGVTHSGDGLGCLSDSLWKTHLIDTTFVPAFVKSLNIKKVGFQSHR